MILPSMKPCALVVSGGTRSSRRRGKVRDFDDRTAAEFQRLRRLRIRIGTMDLKIAFGDAVTQGEKNAGEALEAAGDASADTAKSALATFTTQQLESKWKHAADFGITTPKRNPTTLAHYQAAIESHLADIATIQNGTYLYVPGSKVFYNPNTNLIVILDKDDAFVSGWRLTPRSPQWKKLIIDGVLR